MDRKLRCVKEYRCAEFTARPGDVFTVEGTGQYSMTAAKAEQVLRDFPHCWEEASEEPTPKPEATTQNGELTLWVPAEEEGKVMCLIPDENGEACGKVFSKKGIKQHQAQAHADYLKQLEEGK